MPWRSISFKSLSRKSQEQGAAEMGMCLSRSECPCDARSSVVNVSTVAPSAEASSGCNHFVRLSGLAMSPFTARIRIALQFKDIQPDVVEPPIQQNDSSGASSWLDHDIGGRLPSLEHGADIITGSSDVILEYIERQFKQPSLIPSWRLKGKTRNWVAYIRDVFTPLILGAWKNRNLALGMEFRSEAEAAFARLNACIAENAKEGQFFMGKSFTMVDVYLIPILELLEPLKFLRGIQISSDASWLVDYMRKMRSFPSYAPLAADPEILQVMASRELEEQFQTAPILGYTALQHMSISRHLGRLVELADELTEFHLGRKLRKKKMQVPTVVQVTATTKLRKATKDYDRLLTLMTEHARMEETIIFPALEKAERGITKTAIEEHARDFPVMNGVREDIKTVMVLDQGSVPHVEALSALAVKLRLLTDYTVKHFANEEKELLPLLDVAGVGTKQQESLMLDGLRAMPSSHSELLPFFLSSLLPHEIHLYMIMLHRSLRDVGLESIVEALRSNEEFENVWKIVQERVPLMVATGNNRRQSGSSEGRQSESLEIAVVTGAENLPIMVADAIREAVAASSSNSRVPNNDTVPIVVATRVSVMVAPAGVHTNRT